MLEKLETSQKNGFSYLEKFNKSKEAWESLEVELVKGRNEKNLIHTLKALKNKKFNKFLICGVRHVVSKPLQSDADLKPDQVKESDLQSSLRTYLNDKPHVILYPRPR